MAGVQEQIEIKFRLHDGSDIGPTKYPAATTIATLKESILAEWPKGTWPLIVQNGRKGFKQPTPIFWDEGSVVVVVAESSDGFMYPTPEIWNNENKNAPRTVNDVKLINAGKILENNKTLDECKSPICDLSGGVTTMHVVVRPPSSERGIEKKPSKKVEQKCGCTIQ